jgi:hypothetical protein
MLLPVVGRDEEDRRTMIQAIGPFWDGNEVWLIIAGAATFAAFPVWYATMFSGYYVAFLLLLILLIVRVISFEWRGKAESPVWRAAWTWLNTIAAVGIPLIWESGSRACCRACRCRRSRSSPDRSGISSRPTVVAGLAFVALFALHGAVYLGLHAQPVTSANARSRRRVASRSATAVGAAFLVWTLVVGIDKNDKGVFPGIVVVARCCHRSCRRLRPPAAKARVPCDRRGGRARGRPAVHRALPAGDGLLDQLRLQPHDQQRVVRPLHADGDEHLRARRCRSSSATRRGRTTCSGRLGKTELVAVDLLTTKSSTSAGDA